MEQLQRQQQAKLEMERKERQFREAHILYAQQLAAQQAIMASARAQGTPLTPDFYSKNSRDRALKGGQGPPAARGPIKTSSDLVHEEDAADEMDRGRGSEGDEDEDDEMMMDGEDEEEEESEGLEFLRRQSLALQQAAVGVPPYPYAVYAASPSAAKKRALSPTTKVKDEPEDSLNDQQSFNTPNGLGDWSLDDSLKQVCVLYFYLLSSCSLPLYHHWPTKAAIQHIFIQHCIIWGESDHKINCKESLHVQKLWNH